MATPIEVSGFTARRRSPITTTPISIRVFWPGVAAIACIATATARWIGAIAACGPPRGYRYVEDDRGNYLFVALATGVILSVLLADN